MNRYKVPSMCRSKAYWDQKIQGGKIGIRSGGLGNCGLGMLGSFCGQEFNERLARRDAIASWRSYIDWFSGKADQVRAHFRCPDHIDSAAQYADWAINEKSKYETLYELCKREYEESLRWLRSGPYHQVVFSGCVSEFVPESKGQGAYHKGFHAGRFAAWLAYTGKTVYAGPLSYNPNHASWIQVWTWVPPRGIGKEKVAATTHLINRGVYL